MKKKIKTITLWYHDTHGDLVQDIVEKNKVDDYICAMIKNGGVEPRIVYHNKLEIFNRA